MPEEPDLSGAVLVCVPTYDERDTLPRTLDRLRRSVPEAHVLVVDDSSPDGTGALADARAAEDDHVHVLHRRGKEGLGAAYLAAFAWGLARGAAVLVEMDADGSHAPEELPRLLAPVLKDGADPGAADLVIGSRYVPGGRLVGWPKRRQLLSRTANTYVRLALALPVKDSTAGYRAYRADLLRRLRLEDVEGRGYSFQVDLARRAVAAGARVAEVPITFTEREAGVSKMSGAVIGEELWKVTVWGARRLTGRGRGDL